jgi:hypothetical protein
MGILASCCPTGDTPNNAGPKQGPRGALRIQGVRNETEDPHAPLLTKRPDRKPEIALNPDFDDFLGTLSSDDGPVPDNDEVDAILNKAD